jgi:hypothetical protein
MCRVGGIIPDMRKFLSFYRECAKSAAHGNAAFANDWQWLFGIPICAGFAIWFASKYQVTELTTGYPIADGMLGASGAFAVTWIFVFLGRFLNAPVLSFHEQKDRADALEKRLIPPCSDIDIILDGLAYESICDENGDRLAPCRAFIVRLTNRGEKFLQNCQITFGADPCIYPVSGCFDLRRGEHKHLPVLRIKDIHGRPENDKDDRHALVYFLSSNNEWKISASGPAWCVVPGFYQIRVVSADTAPAVLDVELSKDSDWKLEKAAA